MDYCLVGEATCTDKLGDTIKNGRRGSLSGSLRIIGLQGHIAYPHLCKNPIHDFAPTLLELVNYVWDEGNVFFPATSWQISNIKAGTGANNVIPGLLELDFNFRFSNENTSQSLKEKFQAVLDKNKLKYELIWQENQGGEPFLTKEGVFMQIVKKAIKKITKLDAVLSTSGGTSDGRFIRQICPEVLEFGPINASIHKVNEHINLNDLEQLKNIYLEILNNIE